MNVRLVVGRVSLPKAHASTAYPVTPVVLSGGESAILRKPGSLSGEWIRRLGGNILSNTMRSVGLNGLRLVTTKPGNGDYVGFWQGMLPGSNWWQSLIRQPLVATTADGLSCVPGLAPLTHGGLTTL